ncbi:MAG: hypothetical protein A2339_02525 [Elusimicrobia bacterium RIFOXYB12_FULL_50_12]|nr:MAG: hypothetical protein A2278_06615 [Elusimicrobia bacterium RIFOXYA12_FULL_49_49]OGS11876.1 MAG: hypothetical protein A2386_06230 [Elusimicrobia bacterium RIFOXYB1_FULL_48_9]OGS16280.1 MAG: hypothetical protein A2251_01570 [Elusimicrobia bacterium RIFOXYA2_FULL_47_53]OGS26178.1 MAG: hypothetical protein A2339_02525 [Elusimicrobia bacterium RIFOXYB12_FULL_50_12]
MPRPSAAGQPAEGSVAGQPAEGSVAGQPANGSVAGQFAKGSVAKSDPAVNDFVAAQLAARSVERRHPIT